MSIKSGLYIYNDIYTCSTKSRSEKNFTFELNHRIEEDCVGYPIVKLNNNKIITIMNIKPFNGVFIYDVISNINKYNFIKKKK